MKSRFVALTGVVVIAASTFAACGGGTSAGFVTDAGAFPPGKDAMTDATKPSSDGYVIMLGPDGSSEGGTCLDHCSADLHDVLDCNEHIVKTCPPTEGCGAGGMCVPACESAAANQSTVGCDYYSIVPAGGVDLADGSCFAAYIANTWNAPVALSLDYAGTSIPLDNLAVIPSGSGTSITYAPLPGGMLPAGQLAILFLNDAASTGSLNYVGCPPGITAAITASPASADVTSIINGFHITSSAPVVAYDTFPYGGSSAHISSATLLIPTTGWGKNYLAVDSYAMSLIADGAQPFIQIIAAEDGTQVTLSPTVAIVGGTGVAPAGMGVPTTYDLDAGQVLQLQQDEELNGTPIQSNKPIGVWGGSACMNIGVSDGACDSGHQQLFPISALGSEYVAVRYRPRDPAQPDEAPPWRIMGAVDGTILTYDPSVPPAGAPTTLASGQLALFYSAGPFVVKSQDNKHPFYVAGHMGGIEFMGGDYGTGDPEHVNVMPPEEYLANYIFMTDPTMNNTNLVLIRSNKATGSFADVSLDCLAAPVATWSPIGTAGTYEYAWVDLVVAGAPQGGCNNGYHTIKSTAPFGLTVWGWDFAVSYAYPAGASVQPINTVVVPPTPPK
jgi:hypothetical protein